MIDFDDEKIEMIQELNEEKHHLIDFQQINLKRIPNQLVFLTNQSSNLFFQIQRNLLWFSSWGRKKTGKIPTNETQQAPNNPLNHWM